MSAVLINSTIAKLTHMTSGMVGRDWRPHRLFVVPDKGREWDAIIEAIEALRAARAELEQK